MKIHIILALVCIQYVFAGTPTEAFSAFKKSAQTKDLETTWKYAAKFKFKEPHGDKMISYLKSEVQVFIDRTEKGWDYQIIEEKIDGDCAMVIINKSKKEKQKAFDMDPVYLIKEDGDWKVFPQVSRYDIVKILAKDKVETYIMLEQWFETRSAELKNRQAEQDAPRNR